MPATQATQNALGRLIEFVLLRQGAYQASWTFFIPPESYEQSEPVRQQTIRTLEGGYSDLFGPDLPQITIEGTTGYDIRTLQNGNIIDGYSYWLQFLNTIYRTFIDSSLLNPADQYELHFYNWTHQQYFSVMPTACTWDMAIPENTVFYYNLELMALEPLLTPHIMGYSVSYSGIVVNNTHNFVAVAQNGAQHSAQAQWLLGMWRGYGVSAVYDVSG